MVCFGLLGSSKILKEAGRRFRGHHCLLQDLHNKISPYCSTLNTTPWNTVSSTVYPLLLQEVKKISEINQMPRNPSYVNMAKPLLSTVMGAVWKMVNWGSGLESSRSKGALLYILGGETQRASHRTTVLDMRTKWPVNGRPCVVYKTQSVLSVRKRSMK